MLRQAVLGIVFSLFGLVSAGARHNSAPRDGTTLAALTNWIAMDPLFNHFAGRFAPLTGTAVEAFPKSAYRAPSPIVAEATKRVL